MGSHKVNVNDLTNIWHTKTTVGGKPEPITFTKAPNLQPTDANTILTKIVEPTLPITNRVANRKCVIIESPYASEDTAMMQRHVNYAKYAFKDSMSRGEAPMAGFILYGQMMNDRQKIDHDIALVVHLSWIPKCDLLVVYADYGISPGMQAAINTAKIKMVKTEYRIIGRVAG